MSNPQKIIKQIDYETLLPFQSKIPFDLTHRPKPIVQTSPLTKVETPCLDVNQSELREKYRKTKPRVCMPYQICVDDLDPETYEFYVNQIYGVENKKSLVKDISVNIYEKPDPVRYKTKLKFDDNRTQSERDYAHEKFKRKLIQMKSCKTKEETSKISDYVKQLVNSNKVRMLYDKLKPGYAGYCPNFGGKVPLEKKDFYKIDQCVTTLQIMQKNYKKF